MRFAHIGDKSAVGLADVDQFGDITGMRSTHLDKSEVVFSGHAQERQRYADAVVQVALSIEQVVFLLQYSRRQFLGCGLAVGARDAYNPNPQLASPVARQFL